MAWFYSAFHLLLRAIVEAPPLVGTNWGGVIFAGVVFVVSEVRSLCKNGFPSTPSAWGKNIWSSFVNAIIAWCLLVGLNVGRIVWNEHQAFIAEKPWRKSTQVLAEELARRPLPKPKPAPLEHISAVSYELHIATLGRAPSADVHIHNSGRALRVYISESSNFIKDIQDYSGRSKWEDQLWSDLTEKSKTNDMLLTVPTGDNGLLQIPGWGQQPVTDVELSKLKDGFVYYFAAMVLDEHRKTILEVCFHSSSTVATGIVFCINHNR